MKKGGDVKGWGGACRKHALREPRNARTLLSPQNVIAEHEIRNISCAAQDPEDLCTFAYITKDLQTSHHYCHVFSTVDVVSEGPPEPHEGRGDCEPWRGLALSGWAWMAAVLAPASTWQMSNSQMEPSSTHPCPFHKQGD